jgi:Domain of unknown function (DUF4124)
MRIPFAFPIILVLAGTLSASAAASMYKCAGEGNQPVYQDSPCPAGKELRNFDQNPVEIGIMPFNQDSATTPRLPAAKDAPPKPPTAGDAKKLTEVKRDAAERRFLRSGMTEAEVTAKAGPPDMTSGVKGRKSARWSYLPSPGDPKTITTVTFDNGKVTDVERKVVP